MVKSSERSKAFTEGYNACAKGISRPRNPYNHDGYSAEQTSKFQAWHSGWNTCFHGEAVYEGEPDP